MVELDPNAISSQPYGRTVASLRDPTSTWSYFQSCNAGVSSQGWDRGEGTRLGELSSGNAQDSRLGELDKDLERSVHTLVSRLEYRSGRRVEEGRWREGLLQLRPVDPVSSVPVRAMARMTHLCLSAHAPYVRTPPRTTTSTPHSGLRSPFPMSHVSSPTNPVTILGTLGTLPAVSQ